MSALAIAVIVLTVAVVALSAVIGQMRRTLADHQRHLDALSTSVGAQARHLAAHDGGLALLRQDARR